MSTTSIYPVLMTADVEATAQFFRDHFDFSVAFDADWYVSLRRDAWELAILDSDHETVPSTHRGANTTGMILNIEVEDVDAEYHRLVEVSGLQPVAPLRSEAFGQRHFIITGPDDVLIDVITPIEPEESFTAHFADEHA